LGEKWAGALNFSGLKKVGFKIEKESGMEK
jgi:hypothetical protein